MRPNLTATWYASAAASAFPTRIKIRNALHRFAQAPEHVVTRTESAHHDETHSRA